MQALLDELQSLIDDFETQRTAPGTPPARGQMLKDQIDALTEMKSTVQNGW